MAAFDKQSMKWMRIDLAGLAACIGITAAAYMMVFQPLAEAEAQREAQQVEVTVRQDRATRLGNTITTLRHELAKLQKAASENPIQLHSAQHSNQRLADLTRLAADHELQLNEVRTGSIIASNRYDIVPLHLSGLGTYQTCTAFLHKLRENFPDTAISSFDLTDNPTDPEAPTVFRFQLTWYAATSLANASK